MILITYQNQLSLKSRHTLLNFGGHLETGCPHGWYYWRSTSVKTDSKYLEVVCPGNDMSICVQLRWTGWTLIVCWRWDLKRPWAPPCLEVSPGVAKTLLAINQGYVVCTFANSVLYGGFPFFETKLIRSIVITSLVIIDQKVGLS